MSYANTLHMMQISQMTANTAATNRVGFKVDALRREVASTNAMFEQYARHSLSLQYASLESLKRVEQDLQELRVGIERLAELAENPEQTWAWEQFRIGLSAYNDGHWDEALSFINHAISGYQGHTGYVLEPRFHFLRGRLLSGEDATATDQHVDLSEAARSYELAGKFAMKPHPQLASRALWSSAEIFFAIGELESAKLNYEQSLKIDPLQLAALEGAAKVNFLLGDTSKAVAFFEMFFKLDLRRIANYAEDEELQSLLSATIPAAEKIKNGLIAQIEEYQGKVKSIKESVHTIRPDFSDEIKKFFAPSLDSGVPSEFGIAEIVSLRQNISSEKELGFDELKREVERFYLAASQDLRREFKKSQFSLMRLVKKPDIASFDRKSNARILEKKTLESLILRWSVNAADLRSGWDTQFAKNSDLKASFRSHLEAI